MSEKQQAIDILVDGKIYRLSVADPAYISRVGAYINTKIEECKGSKSYRGLDSDYRHLLVNLNIADDVFRREKELEEAQKKAEDTEKELYGLRHDIVSTRMKLEAAEKERQQLLEQISVLKKKAEAADREKGFNRERGR